tara:strand:+ start:359 stop:547 length:189 start_codon:yes stop_codon:yes gene_type:complete
VAIAKKLKVKPIGARLLYIKVKLLILNKKLIIQRKLIDAKQSKDIQADGTCTYMILTESPCI